MSSPYSYPCGKVHVFITEGTIVYNPDIDKIVSGCGREKLSLNLQESYWAYATDEYKTKYGICPECNLYLILGELAE